MYTNSLDDEMEFLLALSKSSDGSMKDGECIEVVVCPNCQDGVVVTRCIQNEQAKRFEHYCESCGEKFNISKIKAEVFFNKQCWMLKELKTPFGDVSMKLNGKPFSFRYRVYVHENQAHTKPIMVSKMSIDLSKLKIGDVLTLGFSDNILTGIVNDKDTIIYSCNNDTSVLGFCLYLNKNCYRVLDTDNRGFSCEIVSCEGFIVFALICLNTKDYKHEDMISAFESLIRQ